MTGQLARGTVVTHGATSVTGVECPAEGLGTLVGGVDDAGDVVHDDISTLTPLLNGKMLNVDVTRARRRLAVINHGNGSQILFIEGGGSRLRKTKLGEDGTKILCNLGSLTSADKFGLSTGSSDSSLKLRLVSNRTTSEAEDKASNRATGLDIDGMGGIDDADELKELVDRKGGQGRVGNGLIEGDSGKGINRHPISFAAAAGEAEAMANSSTCRQTRTKAEVKPSSGPSRIPTIIFSHKAPASGWP